MSAVYVHTANGFSSLTEGRSVHRIGAAHLYVLFWWVSALWLRTGASSDMSQGQQHCRELLCAARQG